MPPDPSSVTDDPASLARRVADGDLSAVSAALNRIDDDRPANREAVLALLDALEGGRHGARIGVTGAPGSGKSTLLDALVSRLHTEGRSVGILAVDPSSQRTGGALLGDRMRLGSAAREAGVFLRSLAARDQLGGLSEITGASLDVLSAAFDLVFVETVGVGQSEAGVTDLVETLIFVAQPASGDLIQFMKAGILEWPDIFFVNKSDLGGRAERTVAELRAGLTLGHRRDPGFEPPVLAGSARDGVGIDELIAAIDAHQAYLKASGQGGIRRREGRIARARTAIVWRYGRFGLARLGGEGVIEARVDAHPGVSIERIIHDLGREIEHAFATPSGD
ncbi:MAG TPA: methylmalonyl Co-A mutase-associated GTPase MeaB [Deltaproteobacteria bacterium]|nr:methylmalonyl Co-A mutase-associated GTPase MeaB [Deltaproteobacteria bacterium]